MFIFNPVSKTKNITIPPSLKKGDHIAIIATARKINEDLLISAEDILKGWGLIPVRSSNLLKQHHQFSGSDSERRSDLQWAMDEPHIKAVLCYRGGYGTVRILDGLNCQKLCENPKWFIGYSDVTALHQYLNTQAAMASIHGTMAINFTENTTNALNSLKSIIFDKSVDVSFNSNVNNRTGEVTAEVIGGNLSIIQSLNGSTYDIDTQGKILFIEDVDEYLYNIDRMMWSLKLNGKLEHLAGLIVGGMTQMNDNEEPFGHTPFDSILEKVKDYNYPVCLDFPSGHINDNRAIPLGVKLKLNVSNDLTSLKAAKINAQILCNQQEFQRGSDPFHL